MIWRGALLIAFTLPAFAVTYVGAAACAKCHAEESRKWAGSRHSKMLQRATAESVRGDFTRGTVQLRGLEYRLAHRDGAYFITESYLTGKPQEHRVDFTLGNRRIQHYLTRLASGRIVVLAPSWDVLRKQWFHNFDIGDPDESGEIEVQVWNKGCFSCHVSQEEKHFDADKDEYHTTWLDFGTNCERCHGPGSEHVKAYAEKSGPAASAAPQIILQTRLDPARNTGVCAQCHSFRDIFVQGYTSGADYYDHFFPILEYSQPVDKDPAYWPDGRTRRFSNDAFGLWQSECFLKGGATCLRCHVTAHETEIERSPQLRPDANALCTQCHQALAKDVPAHTHHAAASAGSSCVECHMPRTVYSIKAEIRDHSMTIPVPENTLRHQIPNACNLCHKDRDAAWAAQKMNTWYGSRSRQKLIRRADAFAAARAGSATAVLQLLAILAEPAEGPLVRANALGYLASWSAKDPDVFAAFERALDDSQPLVRATAALRIAPSAEKRPAAVAALTRALADSVATVRLGAGASLVNLGVSDLPGADGERLEAAKQLFRARAVLTSDDAQQQLGAGRFYLLAGDPVRAIGALRTSLKLDPEVPAQYFLAYAYAQQADYRAARELLQTIGPSNAQYGKAQQLLKAIEGH
jgi:predicted CXXCH cytochrome family protein